MNTDKSLPVIALAAGICILYAGCSYKSERVIYTRPDPPAAKVEVVTVAPYEGAVWEKGYWVWRPRAKEYVWVPGRWRRP